VESWRSVFRRGFAPLLSTESLEALERALEQDDPFLIQDATTRPVPLQCTQDWPCEGACLIGYAGWATGECNTVGEVAEFFSQKCVEADQRLGAFGQCAPLLNYFDDTPREEAFPQLLGEVRRALGERERHCFVNGGGI